MNKFKLIIIIAVVVILPFILIGLLSTIQNRSKPELIIQSTPTPTPKTSNINEFKTLSGRIVEIDPEYIIISANGTTQTFEFDRDIDITRFQVEQIITLVFSKEGENLVMDILKR